MGECRVYNYDGYSNSTLHCIHLYCGLTCNMHFHQLSNWMQGTAQKLLLGDDCVLCQQKLGSNIWSSLPMVFSQSGCPQPYFPFNI